MRVPPAAPKTVTQPKEPKASQTVLLPDVPADQKWVVKKGDVVWNLVKTAMGPKASNADIVAMLATLKKDNPGIENLDVVYPGNEIKIPDALRAKQGAQTGKPPVAADGGKAEAAAQMAAAKQAREAEVAKFGGALHTFTENVRNTPNLSESQVGQVRDTLGKVKSEFPELYSGPDCNLLRSRLPDGDALKAEGGAPAATSDSSTGAATSAQADAPSQQEHDALGARFNSWAKAAQSAQLGIDERMTLGAAFDTALVKYPDLKETPAVKSLMAQQPISPAEADEQLQFELARAAAAASTGQFSQSERREAGKLLERIDAFAPRLANTDEYDTLVAQQPISTRQEMAEQMPTKLKAYAASVSTKQLSLKERHELGKFMQGVQSLRPDLVSTPEFQSLLAHSPLVAR